MESVWVIHMIRTTKIPFVQSKPSVPLFLSTFIVAVVALATVFTDFAIGLDMHRLPLQFIPWLLEILSGYPLCVQLVKRVYVHRHGDGCNARL